MSRTQASALGATREAASERAPSARLFCASEFAAPQCFQLGPGMAAVFSRQSPFKAGPNEDAALLVRLDERRAVLAVADGVGGMPGAREAAQAALSTLSQALCAAAPRPIPLREVILAGIERAHAAVGRLRQGGATTLALAEIDGRSVRSYHIGDSGILVVGQRGRLRFQTTFHSPVGYALEAGLLDEREAILHADRHLLSNALGHESMHVEVGVPLDLQPKDTVVIASDGLFDNLHTQEIAQRARRGRIEDAVSSLVELCRARMLDADGTLPSKPDDLTVVAYRAAPAKLRGAARRQA